MQKSSPSRIVLNSDFLATPKILRKDIFLRLRNGLLSPKCINHHIPLTRCYVIHVHKSSHKTKVCRKDTHSNLKYSFLPQHRSAAASQLKAILTDTIHPSIYKHVQKISCDAYIYMYSSTTSPSSYSFSSGKTTALVFYKLSLHHYFLLYPTPSDLLNPPVSSNIKPPLTFQMILICLRSRVWLWNQPKKHDYSP